MRAQGFCSEVHTIPASLTPHNGWPQLPCWLSDKEPSCNAGDLGLISASGRSPGERNGYSLQYACLENSVERGVWRAIVHGVTKSRTTTERLTLSQLVKPMNTENSSQEQALITMHRLLLIVHCNFSACLYSIPFCILLFRVTVTILLIIFH